MEGPRLEIDMYQIADDAFLKRNRSDGSGWDWGWAPPQRDWMDATPSRFAYRCLPLTIVNQTGLWVANPVGFSVFWNGQPGPGSVSFHFDVATELWKNWINDQFGMGIITWNTPFLFRTRPQGSRLLVCGPTNSFKPFVQPLTALIESDWMSMSFTMNWKITMPHMSFRFEAGEPLFQVIPLLSNVCADLEGALVRYQKLSESPEMSRAYQDWHDGRRDFHQKKSKGEVKADDWQKDYFQGRDAIRHDTAPDHMTRVAPPPVHYSRETNPNPNPSPNPSPKPKPPVPAAASAAPAPEPKPKPGGRKPRAR